MTGTFQILAPAVVSPSDRAVISGPTISSAGWYNQASGLTTDAALIAALNNENLSATSLRGATTLNETIDYSFGLVPNIISLDGAPPISYAGLPPGFTMLSAQVDFGTSVVVLSNAGGPTVCNADIFFNFMGQQVPLNTTSPAGDSFPTQQIIVDMSFPAPTMLDLMNATLNIDVTTTTNNAFISSPNSFRVSSVVITGTYSADSFQYSLETPSEPVDAGDPITATSPDVNGIDYTLVTSVTIEYPGGGPIVVDPSDWITIEANLFTFLMPSFGGDEPPIITVSITSTQFSGSVTLGQLITIYFTSASGLYRLIPSQRYDELYIEDDPGETIDVKIPNPFFRTGFIGG